MAKVFISYVKEDALKVERLAQELGAKGISVWLDRKELLPGMRWRDAIREAISAGDFFLACFSENYHRRDKTYMNEELVLAIEELRSRSATRIWFLPVILDECDIPARNIGAGETLLDLQWVNLSVDWNRGIERIAATILSDEIEVARLKLRECAKWVRKREMQAAPTELVAKETYAKLRQEFRERYGVDYDPLAEV